MSGTDAYKQDDTQWLYMKTACVMTCVVERGRKGREKKTLPKETTWFPAAGDGARRRRRCYDFLVVVDVYIRRHERVGHHHSMESTSYWTRPNPLKCSATCFLIFFPLFVSCSLSSTSTALSISFSRLAVGHRQQQRVRAALVTRCSQMLPS